MEKEYKNTYYLDHIREYLDHIGLYLNKESLGYVKKNLSEDLFKEFSSIVFNLGLIKIAQDSLIGYNGGEYYKRKDVLGLFKEKVYLEVNGVDKNRFLRMMGGGISSVATYYGKKEVKDSKRIWNSWLSEVQYVLNTGKGEKRKKIVKKLLGIVSSATAQEIRDEDEKRKKRSGLRRHIWINLDEELDLSKLKITKDYWIQTLQDTSSDLPKIIEQHDGYIYINGKRESLSSLYENWFNNYKRGSKTIKLDSDDLLDNIFALYLIKRAQNGDDDAVEILCKKYQKMAERKALRFIREKASGREIERFSESGFFSEEDIKSVARDILRLLIKGDNPSVLMSEIDSVDDAGVELVLNRKIHRILFNLYEEKLKHYNITTNYISLLDVNFRKKLKDLNCRAKQHKKIKPNTEAHYLEKIISLSLDYIAKLDINCRSRDLHFDIYSNIIYFSNYNKWTYKPNKKTNLTSWLFGSVKSEGKFGGMFWQKLNDWFRSKTYTKSGKRYIKNEDYAFTELKV
jgi:hypothetical protein